MGFPKYYFPANPNEPPPLMAETTRRVRFEEVDALGMVWHGRYPSYFEDGRISFGDRYGLSYPSFIENRTKAPIVQMHFDFKAPLRFDETMKISTSLHWCEAVRLNFSYRIFDPRGTLAASGYTVQLLTDMQDTVLIVGPEWLAKFRDEWQSGGFEGKK
ncbi:MAG: acyl-CoA thioesterase [Thermodesulfobacteriota bacterium]